MSDDYCNGFKESRVGRGGSDAAPFNPYRAGAYYIRKRLLWDLSPESWRSRGKIQAWKGRFAGAKAVICCNGPSLNRVNFDSLSGTFCIGLNKINLLFSRSQFRPNCVVAVNKLVIEQNADFYNETDIPLFLGHGGAGIVRPRDNVAFLHSIPATVFAPDVSLSVGENATVTNVALQLAYFMGFRKIALVGADHSYMQSGKPNSTVKAEGTDVNHFDPNYFGNGTSWQLADLAQSEIGYFMARKAFEAAGGEVVNATDGGHLEIFERRSLQAFLAEGN